MSIFRVTLQQVGAVDYFCRFHPDMTRRILATPHGGAVNSFDPCGRYIAGWITAGTPRWRKPLTSHRLRAAGPIEAEATE
jgi:hypothetical protein